MGCTGGERSAALSKAERWGAEWSAPGPAQAVCAACRETRSVFTDAQFSEAVLWRGVSGQVQGDPLSSFSLAPNLEISIIALAPWAWGRGRGVSVPLDGSATLPRVLKARSLPLGEYGGLELGPPRFSSPQLHMESPGAFTDRG